MCADNVKFAMSNVKLLSYFAPVKSPPPMIGADLH